MHVTLLTVFCSKDYISILQGIKCRISMTENGDPRENAIADRVIEKLKKEDAELKELIAQENAQILTLAGDTVDIWKQQRWHVFDANKGENILSFTIDTDENFKERDHFTLRFHTINTPSINNDAVAHIAIRHKKHI